MTVLSLLGYYLSSHEVHFHRFVFINPFILHEKTAWIYCKSLLTPTYYVSSTTEPNVLLSVYIVGC